MSYNVSAKLANAEFAAKVARDALELVTDYRAASDAVVTTEIIFGANAPELKDVRRTEEIARNKIFEFRAQVSPKIPNLDGEEKQFVEAVLGQLTTLLEGRVA